MRKIAIFGACREGLEVYRALFSTALLNGEKIEFCFLDNDSRLDNSLYEGCAIYKPNNINLQQFDIIVIGIIQYERAYTQLISLGAIPDRIKRFYSEIYFSKKERKVGIATIGKYSYFKPSTILYFAEIGNYCHIGADCRLGLIGHDSESVTTYPLDYQFGTSDDSLDSSKDKTSNKKRSLEPLRISHDVYIGEGVTIMAGINIGTGAIIGSKSVVTKDVPPFTVVAGIPAKQISTRLSSVIQEKLLESKWWNMDEIEAGKQIAQISKLQ